VESDEDLISPDFIFGLLNLIIPTRSYGKIELMLVPTEDSTLRGREGCGGDGGGF